VSEISEPWVPTMIEEESSLAVSGMGDNPSVNVGAVGDDEIEEGEFRLGVPKVRVRGQSESLTANPETSDGTALGKQITDIVEDHGELTFGVQACMDKADGNMSRAPQNQGEKSPLL
jgi:hypothetical protein